jgi:uroporphyrinogen decarboxylase
MSLNLDGFPEPSPDVERLKTVLRRGLPDRVPLIELAIAEEVLAAVAGRDLAALPERPSAGEVRDYVRERVALWRRLGYDYYRLRIGIPFQTRRLSAGGKRAWVNENAGMIGSREEFERYPWPTATDVDFSQAEAAIECLPEGMGAIGFSGGVLEWASELIGLENTLLMLYDDPELLRDVVDRVGQIIYDVFARCCTMDEVFALWLGDDLGFKTSTLISPEHLREFILPWHRRYAELAHASGRLFMLHSCGHVEAVMENLIADVGIDAKHSFEDVIVPVEAFQARWGDRVAVLGGVDVDLLSRGSTEDVRARTLRILETCAPRGGYACGSGNSVTDYVPAANYLAMVAAAHEYNGNM